MPQKRWPGVALIGLMLLASTACRSVESRKLAHLQKGDQYAAQKRDDFAVIEYANAVQLDPMFGEARFKLAQAYERLNNLPAAFPEYIRAADSLPDDRNAQGKAAQVLLLLGRFADAEARAAALLAKNPKDIDALLIQANAKAGLRDPAGAMAQIAEAIRLSPGSSQAFLNLGVLRVQQGEANEAETAFRKAIALDPRSVDSRLALANFLWAAGRAKEAESALQEAIAIEPLHPLANRMLSSLYMASGRSAEAEKSLKVLADASRSPGARFQLAEYYLEVGRRQEAATVLKGLSAERATHADAEVELAAIEQADGRAEDARKRLDSLLTKVPNHTRGLILKAAWLARANDLDEALKVAKTAVASDPRSAEAHFTLGAIHARRRENADAIKAYTEVLSLNPRATAAQLELARLNFSTGNESAALQFAEEARSSAPSNLDANLAVVRGLIAAKELARAGSEVRRLREAVPNSAAVQVVSGVLYASQNDAVAARAAYERALQLSPFFPEAMARLTYLDIAEKAPARAIARLEPAIAKDGNNTALLALLAEAYRASGDMPRAEESLRRAVSGDPRFQMGYAMLAQLYTKQGRLEEARKEWEQLVSRDPVNTGARTMVGVLLETQGKRDAAMKTYEEAVKSDPRAAVAANNLAYIYAEQGTSLDMALQLATSAKQVLPNDSSIDDTIGWVYYKKGLPSLAVGPLKESLKKQPDQPEVLYHLGMSYAKLGDKAKAKEALARALTLNPKVGGDEARRALQSVQ
ncbi:hypothetical protein TBR22_A52920 [Luteitalea sp. TBR-22]|uniref:tetratricopeptide repeat protein n=1 Tax=Luteitalea sp. TBR-22 TaxID=2802971 RepID=UPI001AF711DD|nr:tetratricopeptide repeat protein [Luteitalea sp. TBR-22]BCS36055.1 hypothetical protein TBR22_A52920 [Luteitalea sp. TBR-22]